MGFFARADKKPIGIALQTDVALREKDVEINQQFIDHLDLLSNFPLSNMASFQDNSSVLSCYTWWARHHLKPCIDTYRRITPGRLTESEAVKNVFKIWKSIASELKRMEDTSLSKILDKVAGDGLIVQSSQSETRIAIQLIHSIIGIQSMLYTSGEPEDPLKELVIKSEMNDFEGQAIMSDRQDFSCTGESLDQYLLQFGILLPPPMFSLLERQAREEYKVAQCTQVRPSVLNTSNLATTGHVRIRWTDSLACHLEFNANDRELFLFRYPSYCIYAWSPEPDDELSRGAIHGCATQKSQHQEWASPHEVSQLLREIVLSYRLLFGQDRASRRFYSRALDPWSDVPSAGQDKMLDSLCTKQRLDTGLQCSEKDIYTLKSDFPMLHAKLVRLQMFLDSTRPQTIRELWNDRRDNTSWLTLWLVLIIGSLGLLFAFMQVVLQIVQIALQARAGS